MRQTNYKEESKMAKQYIRKSFVAVVPAEWTESRLMEDSFRNEDDVEIFLERNYSNISLYIQGYISEGPDGNPQDFDHYVTYHRDIELPGLDYQLLSDEFINLGGVEGYRTNSISKYPSEYTNQYTEQVKIIFMKNEMVYFLTFHSKVNSRNETKIIYIEDDIQFICNNMKTKKIID